jgi:ATP-dependent Clp protease ATP-binding subunit ClpA
MMVLLISFLEALKFDMLSVASNERIVSHHINTIRKYIKGRDHELTVIAAIQVFISSCGYNETKSGLIV